MDLAESMLDPSLPEENLRTIISRAYYAAYLMGYLKFRQTKPLIWSNVGNELKARCDCKRVSVHEQLRLAFEEVGAFNVSSKLAELFTQRVTADYRPEEKVEYRAAETGVKLCKNIITLIENGGRYVA